MRYLTVFLALFLAACLPEDTKVSEDANKARDNDYVSLGYADELVSVGNALRQAIMTQSSWATYVAEDGRLNLAAMGVKNESKLAAIACTTDEGRILQIVFPTHVDAKGKFAVDAIGFDTGKLLRRLNNRVSESEVAIFDGKLGLVVQGSKKQIPAHCLSSQRVPSGAPVLIYEIARPQKPAVQLTRVETRTMPCNDVTLDGMRVQKRTVTHKPDGGLDVAAWRDVDVGKCLMRGGVDTDIVEDKKEMPYDAAMLINGLRKAVYGRLGVNDCTNVTVAKKDAKKNDQLNFNNCTVDDVLPTIKAMTESGVRNAEEVRVLSCYGDDTKMAFPSFGGTEFQGVFGFFTYDREHSINTKWSGTVKIKNNRSTLDVSAVNNKKDHTAVSNWIGVQPDGANCVADELTRVMCDEITDRPAVFTNNATRIAQLSTGTRNGKFVYSNNNCWTMGAEDGMDCGRIDPIIVKYINPDYFNSSKKVTDGGVDVKNKLYAEVWDNPAKFTTSIGRRDTSKPVRDGYHLSRNECTWEKKQMLADCPQPDAVTDPGTWNGTITDNRPLSTYDNTPVRLVFYDEERSSDTSVLNIEVDPVKLASNTTYYNSVFSQITSRVKVYTGWGHTHARDLMHGVLKETIDEYLRQVGGYGRLGVHVSRHYMRYLDGFWGYHERQGDLKLGHTDQNLYLKSWVKQGTQGFVVLNSTARNYRNAACNSGAISGAYASLCLSDKLTKAQQTLTRDVCRKPKEVSGTLLSYTSNLTGDLATYCNYLFDEFTYDVGNLRRYAYLFREMPSSEPKVIHTTLLNRHGVTYNVRPYLDVGASALSRPRLTVRSEPLDLHCARQEVELVGVPVKVRNRVNYREARSCHTVTRAPRVAREEHFACVSPAGNVDGRCTEFSGATLGWEYCSVYHTLTTTAVLERVKIREYKSDSGWSTPRYSTAYYSPIYGTFTSLPTEIVYDIPRQVVGNNCKERNAECDAANAEYVRLRQQGLN